MTYSKRIILTLRSFRKSGDAFIDPVCMEYFPAIGKYFMAVSLMTHIPYKLIVGSIKYIMKGYCKFNNT